MFEISRQNFLGYTMPPSLYTVPIKTSRSASLSRTAGSSHPREESSKTIQSGRKLPPRPRGRQARNTQTGSLINITIEEKEERGIQEPISQ
jgi:hypothetical protein